jgi:predicted ATPase
MTNAAPESSRLPPSWTELGFVRAHLGLASIKKTVGGTTTKIGGTRNDPCGKRNGAGKKTLVNEFRGRSCSKIGTFEKHVVTLDQKKSTWQKTFANCSLRL